MADKGTKDMTASELLRKAGNGYEGASGTVMVNLADLMGLSRETRHSECLYAIADKIDAELAQARRSGLERAAKSWAKANGWPDFKDGENFGGWLERCAIPRPRFEDGEPVQFGDDTDELDGVEKFIFLRNGGCCQMQDADGNICNVFRGKRVKRRAPEVLGADGKPIKVGDAMWSLSGAGPLTVTSLHTDDPTPDGGDSPWADLDDDGLYSWIYAGSLTHTPPDTQNAIDDDATMHPAAYCAAYGIDLGDDPDRETTTSAMIADLLRRQREYDKRTGGDA